MKCGKLSTSYHISRAGFKLQWLSGRLSFFVAHTLAPLTETRSFATCVLPPKRDFSQATVHVAADRLYQGFVIKFSYHHDGIKLGGFFICKALIL